MMNRVLMVLSLFTVFGVSWVSGTACNPCICNDWADTLSCVGQEIDSFPNVTGEGISHIDILNTSLTQIPDLIKFSELFTIDIRDNRLIDCQDVFDFRNNNTGMIVSTDCVKKVYKMCVL